MGIKKLLLLMIIVLATSGCTQNTSNEIDVYSNATITLQRDGMYTMQMFAIQKVTINKTGLLYETFYNNGTLSNSVYTKFENNEYENLIEVFKNNKFDKLNNKYSSEIMVADIGRGIIDIKNNYGGKTIEIDPYTTEGNPTEIANIIDRLNEIISNSKSPFEYNVYMKFSPKQCVKNPWDKWYEEGNIQFVKAPTQKELIFAYYSNLGVEINSIEEKKTQGMVCEACNVCPTDNYYLIEIKNSYVEILLENNFEVVEKE